MNLYIINKVLYDYTAGMVVIAAPSMERCRELFVEKFDPPGRVPYGCYPAEDFDEAIEKGNYKVIKEVDHPEGVVSYVLGGG